MYMSCVLGGFFFGKKFKMYGFIQMRRYRCVQLFSRARAIIYRGKYALTYIYYNNNNNKNFPVKKRTLYTPQSMRV